MFFYISKILTFALEPLLWLFIVAIWSWLRLPSNKFTKNSIGLVLTTIWLLSTPFFSSQLFGILEKHPHEPLSDHYDAVIVLGGMVDLDRSSAEGLEFGSRVDRILMGIKLVKENRADFLILSGKDGSLLDRGKNEAELLLDFAISLGVPKQKILIEGESVNTYQNALYSKNLVDEKGFKKILLITSAFHGIRSKGCFNQVGLKVDYLPVDFYAEIPRFGFDQFLPTAGSLLRSSQAIHEGVGILAYGLLGKAKY